MYRPVLLLFLALSPIAAPAQSATELKGLYGDPDVERFRVRPGVKLIARYASDRTACEILIGPMQSIIPRNEPEIYIRPEVMTEIIDEVLPEANRGVLLRSFVTKSGCNEIDTKEYENVTITRFRHKCDLPNPKIEGQAMIERRTSPCSAPLDKPSDATGP